ncbi:MAG: BlaI/MecI/CopY family transcriptional regulator [Streptosporangiaceae bacterium]
MQRFGPLEAAIMDRLWAAAQPVTGRDVVESLDRDPPPGYTTVTKVMDILVGKGFLRRERVGRSYRYAPTASRAAYSAELMSQVLGASHNNEATLLQFVDRLAPAEAAALRAVVGRIADGGPTDGGSLS